MIELLNIIEQKSEELIKRAIIARASDIHLIPSAGLYTIYFRLHTKLIPAGKLHLEIGDRIISYFKFLSSLDISEKRKPQSGSFQKNFNSHTCSFRVSTLPSVQNKESLVIRVQLHDDSKPLHELSLYKEAATLLHDFMVSRQGLLCITGPTGCGKTTTMYSLTSYSAQQLNRHVISLEDPVENSQSHLLQIQVNERSGISYASGLKAILRHSPDVIMIGEIRDAETAQAAVQASLTGHLVITTVHAKNPIGCLYRLMDLGIPIDDLEQAILGITSQQLVIESYDSQDERIIPNRSSLYEILYGQTLEQAIEAIKTGGTFKMPIELTLYDQYRKGVESGLIQVPPITY
ncbi:competence type IV pilus ATPase ComGA [Paenisporosarcina sp. TG20]|uniref:competence type IV pilus ATPase ComGA n=1 Tax=Paenisporosarcina sp. TG20 TaxID=1211706 RepID=UPI0004749F87|nr:competence type IV pilus ATPase ComGA [Paenisporosarcina sp. TG20]